LSKLTSNAATLKPSRLLLRFVSRYQDAQRQSVRDRAETARKKPSKSFDPLNEFAVRARQNRLDAIDRVENGFRLKWCRNIGGRLRQPFLEKGFRTEGNPILKLFITRIRKGGTARASDDKATLYVPSRYKVLTLDCPYLEFNKLFLGVIRLDCDAVFASTAACLELLQHLVDANAIPHLPHIVTGDLLPNGTYHRPHFYYLLPPGSAVWNNLDDARCRVQPVKLFDAVSRGLTKALLPVGVDPAAPRLTMRGKNPISPYWCTLTPNQSEFMSLSDYAKVVDTRASTEELIRHAAATKSELGLTQSNEAFNKFTDRAKVTLREWHFNADPRMSGSKERLAYELHGELERYAKNCGMDEVKVATVLACVASWRAANFDPAKLQSKRADKGRLMHEVAEVKGVAARQKIGANYSAKKRASAAQQKLVAAMEAATAAGKSLSVEDLASAAKVSRAYAYKAFEECQQICLRRYGDKKAGTAKQTGEEPAADIEVTGACAGTNIEEPSETLGDDIDLCSATGDDLTVRCSSLDIDEEFERLEKRFGGPRAAQALDPGDVCLEEKATWPD
jgi:hypothetical protein